MSEVYLSIWNVEPYNQELSECKSRKQLFRLESRGRIWGWQNSLMCWHVCQKRSPRCFTVAGRDPTAPLVVDQQHGSDAEKQRCSAHRKQSRVKLWFNTLKEVCFKTQMWTWEVTSMAKFVTDCWDGARKQAEKLSNRSWHQSETVSCEA